MKATCESCALTNFNLIISNQKNLKSMKLSFSYSTAILALATIIAACSSKEEATMNSHVTTAEEQARLTPDAVLKQFKEGNQRFRSGQETRRDHSEQVRKSAPGQYPKAMVLSCLDSRVPVEDVFDQGIGDVFVGRVAGNFVNEDLLGSMEFACKVAGAKMILVMGHQHCGAIKGAIDDLRILRP